MHSAPASRSLKKCWTKTGPKIEHWGVPLVTGHWADVAPFTMALSSTAELAHHQEKHLYAYLKVEQLVQKDVVRDSIKSLPKIQKDLKQHKGYSLSAASRNPERLPVVNRNYFSLASVFLFLCWMSSCYVRSSKLVSWIIRLLINGRSHISIERKEKRKDFSLKGSFIYRKKDMLTSDLYWNRMWGSPGLFPDEVQYRRCTYSIARSIALAETGSQKLPYYRKCTAPLCSLVVSNILLTCYRCEAYSINQQHR